MSKPFRPPPWYPRYVDDFTNSRRVRLMTWEQRGLYNGLLDLAWQNASCSIPADHGDLAALLGITPEHFAAVMPKVLACFEPHPTLTGELINPRLYQEHLKATERSRQAAHAGRESQRIKSEGSTDVQRSLDARSTDAQRAFNGRSTDVELTLQRNVNETETETETEEEKRENPPPPLQGGDALSAAVESSGGKKPKAAKQPKPPRPDEHESFPAFWAAYPQDRRENRKGAAKSYNAALEKSSPEAILHGLALWKASTRWTDDNGKWIHLPTSFLNQRLFETPPQGANGAPCKANNWGSRPGIYREAPLPPSEETVELPF
jgi:uncharacterized protein YdaU (DUF1376 family)